MVSPEHDDGAKGPARPLRIAMVGTRGVPAAYGGFETAVEEIGRRLVRAGHEVTVYCRSTAHAPGRHLGMRLVHLPAFRTKSLETLSHTLLSALHLVTHRAPDVAFVFNSANSPFLPIIRARGVPVAVHVDGLEWKRGKWGVIGRRYYRVAELLAVWWSDALIADAQGISEYYTKRFAAATDLLTYGAPIITPSTERLDEVGLLPDGFHLVVARFEPENHVEMIVEGYSASSASLPLVVVGSAPYSAEYTARVLDLAGSDGRIRMLGGVFDQELLDELYANAMSYLHGHSVGGTNPSLLRAMGAATAVCAWDVDFNREVLGPAGRFFDSADALRRLIEATELDPDAASERGAELSARASAAYDWDAVSAGYEALATSLAERRHPPVRAGRTAGRRLSRRSKGSA